LIINLLNYFITSLLILVLCFIPGYLILHAFTSLKEDEVIVSSFGVSFLIFFVLSFTAFLLDIKQQTFNIIGFSLITASLLGYIKFSRKSINITNKESKILLFLFAAYYIHIIAYQALTPVYTGGFWYKDWIVHYGVSQFYLSNGHNIVPYLLDYPIVSRPPLYNLINAFFLSIFGEKFWVFQISSSVLNSVIILSVYLLAKKLFNVKTATLVFVFIFFSSFFLRGSIFTWQKHLATYFIILSLYYYLKIRDENFEKARSPESIIFCGLFAGLAGLSHQFSYIYLGALGIDYFLISKLKNFKMPRKDLLLFCTSFFVVIVPYYLWGICMYGLTATILANPSFCGEKYTIGAALLIGLTNMALNVIPLELGYYVIRSVLEGYLYLEKLFDSLLSYYYSTILGGVTTTLSIAFLFRFKGQLCSKIKSIFGVLKGQIKAKEGFNKFLGFLLTTDGCIFTFMLIGFVGGSMVVIYPSHHGYMSNVGAPIVALLLIYITNYLRSLSSQLKTIVIVGVFIEFILTTWMQIIYILYGFRNLAMDGNYMLKMTYDLTFAWDYLGNGWMYFAVLEVFIEMLFLILLYNLFVRFRYPLGVHLEEK